MTNVAKKTRLQTLKGFRDFLPEEARARAYVISVVKKTFESFGYEPLETPALEYRSLLLGKYGNEADKLVYTFEDKGKRKIALRYDQTVPTARVLAMYGQKLGLPLRRYQIQPVWRADKPQAGRYREFLQCDPDIFGTTSPLADAEIIAVSAKVLTNLGFSDIRILLNDRSILFDLMDKVGIPEKDHLSIIQTLDKLDKKGKKGVEEELLKKGLDRTKTDSLFSEIKSAKTTSSLDRIISYAVELGVEKRAIEFRPYLARGLDYYTSTIFELIIDGYKGGSVGGGGRYDKLVEKLSGVSIPATGMAFGFDRLVDAMSEFGLFPKRKSTATVLVTIFGPELASKSIEAVKTLRADGIAAELFPDESAKLDKQLKYADKKGIPYVIIIGPEEVKKDVVVLKDMKSGEQNEMSLAKVIPSVRS